MRLLRGWRPALRIARREAVRARGRSVLVLVMIGLPVLGIVALDTLARTVTVSTVEGLSRQLGSADALVTDGQSNGPVDQTPDMSNASSLDAEVGEQLTPTPDSIRSILGADTKVLERVSARIAVRTEVGLARPNAIGVDLQDPMTRGLFDLRSGRYPSNAEEVVVSGRLAGRGFPVGSTLTLADGTALRVVGTVESTTTRGLNLLAGQVDALGLDHATEGDEPIVEWLVSRPGGVDWETVRALNSEGMFALSRSVVENPPPASEVTVETYGGGETDARAVAVLALVAAMALLEVVLLAGPAFAVGARRQQRALALMAASGAEPPHLRRVVLASGVVLGSAAVVLGAVLGVVVAWLVRPIVQHFSDTMLGPFQVAPRDIAVIAAAGLLSALLAALLPALIAARSDVVAILAGRRGETRTAVWSPVLGALMLSSVSPARRTAPCSPAAVRRSLPVPRSWPSWAWCCSRRWSSACSVASPGCCRCRPGSPSAMRHGTAAVRRRPSLRLPRRSPEWSHSASAGRATRRRTAPRTRRLCRWARRWSSRSGSRTRPGPGSSASCTGSCPGHGRRSSEGSTRAVMSSCASSRTPAPGEHSFRDERARRSRRPRQPCGCPADDVQTGRAPRWPRRCGAVWARSLCSATRCG